MAFKNARATSFFKIGQAGNNFRAGPKFFFFLRTGCCPRPILTVRKVRWGWLTSPIIMWFVGGLCITYMGSLQPTIIWDLVGEQPTWKFTLNLFIRPRWRGQQWMNVNRMKLTDYGQFFLKP